MKQQMILVAGPYRSGTNDAPHLIERNVQFMQQKAYEVFLKGHLPVLGEWFALPLIKEAGSKKIGDEPFNKIFHPISVQLLDKCDAVWRVGGPSSGADEMVRVGKEKGKLIYNSIEEIPVL